MPSISVVLCTCDGALYIRDQLESILNQTCKASEIIVVDDTSVDATVDIVASVATKHPHIKLYKNEHRLGAIKNFEKGLQLAHHDIIAIADQDDIWHPQKIEKLLDGWAPSSPLIYCNSVRFSGLADFSVQSNPKHLRFYGADGKRILMFNTISGHAILLRKNLLRRALPFDENVMYDWWLGMVAAYNGGVSYVPDVLVLQRVHGRNLTVNDKYNYRNAKSRKLYKAMLLLQLQQFCKTPGMPHHDKEVVEKLYFLLREAQHKRFSLPLFHFLWKHRQSFFYFKKKKLPAFSHIKYCWWFSTN